MTPRELEQTKERAAVIAVQMGIPMKYENSPLLDQLSSFMSGFVKPAAEAAPRILGTAAAGMASMPVAGLGGLSKLLTTGDLSQANGVIENIMNAGNFIQTPQQEQSLGYLNYPMKPVEMAGEGWGLIGNLADAQLQKTGMAPTYLEPLLGSMGTAAGMFSLPELLKAKNINLDSKPLQNQRGAVNIGPMVEKPGTANIPPETTPKAVGGKGIKAYHYGPDIISEFENGLGTSKDIPAYFVSSKSNRSAEKFGKNITEVTLDIKNPLDLTEHATDIPGKGHTAKEWLEIFRKKGVNVDKFDYDNELFDPTYGSDNGLFFWSFLDHDKGIVGPDNNILQIIKEAGYDGIKAVEDKATVFVPFAKTQITLPNPSPPPKAVGGINVDGVRKATGRVFEDVTALPENKVLKERQWGVTEKYGPFDDRERYFPSRLARDEYLKGNVKDIIYGPPLVEEKIIPIKRPGVANETTADTTWMEQATKTEITKDPIYGYHHSAADVKSFDRRVTAFYPDSLFPQPYMNSMYRATIPKGTRITWYGENEFRVDLNEYPNMEIHPVREGWRPYTIVKPAFPNPSRPPVVGGQSFNDKVIAARNKLKGGKK